MLLFNLKFKTLLNLIFNENKIIRKQIKAIKCKNIILILLTDLTLNL